MARSNLELQEEVLQTLLENHKEEGILENCGDDLNQCFYLKESIESYAQKREKVTEIIDSREDDNPVMPILEMLTSLANKNISDDIKELEDFFDRQASTCLKAKLTKNKTLMKIMSVFMFISRYFLVGKSKSFFFEKNWKVSKGSLIIF